MSWWDQGRGSLWEAGLGGGNGGTRASGGEVEEGKPSHRWGTSPDLTIHICHCPTTDHCATLLLLLLYHKHTHSVVPPKQGLDRNWFSPVVRLVELLGAGRDTHWTSGSSQTPPRRRRHLKPLISFGQILERISQRKSPTWSWRFFGEVLLFPKHRTLRFFQIVVTSSPLVTVRRGGSRRRSAASMFSGAARLLIVNVY